MNRATSPLHPAITRRAMIPTLAVGAVAAVGAIGACESIAALEESEAKPERLAVSYFIVSPYYGGTLGNGDDQTCIQRTLDAANAAGGGRVVLPSRPDGYVYRYSQLVVPRWVAFTSVGWHTFGASGSIARMQQLPGVNDDSIVFSDNGDSSPRPFIGPFGLADLAIRAAPGATAGHGISFRTSDGRIGLVQDMTTIERLLIRGFPGSGIYACSGSPLRLDYVTTLWTGRYGVEVQDTRVDSNNGTVHQLTMEHISGDGNMGGVPDRGGATVFLKGLMAKKASVSLFDIKSEYRVRPTTDSGDGAAMGNFHAVVIEDCRCPITVLGVEHIATGSQTRKPGNAIQVKGNARPDLMWHSVTVRNDHPSQTVGSEPCLVFDETQARGSNAPHGLLGDSVESYKPDQIATQVDTGRSEELASGESILPRRAVTSGEATLTPGALCLTYFTAAKTEEIGQVRTCTGPEAADGASLCRIGVYEVDNIGNLTLVASTANDTSLWSASNTTSGSAFINSFQKKRGVRYALGCLIVGASKSVGVIGLASLHRDEAAESPRLCGSLRD